MESFMMFWETNGWLLLMLIAMMFNFYTRVGVILICMMMYLGIRSVHSIVLLTSILTLLSVVFKSIKFFEEK